MPETPAHLKPDACYVCGHGQHGQSPGQHPYWSNADAAAEFAAEDAKRTVRYANGAATPEAAYVAEHRPY